MMKRRMLLNTLAMVGTFNVSCGSNSPSPEGQRSTDAVLASLGTIDPKPEGAGDLVYELTCDALPAVIGALKNTGESAVVEFKRTATNPLAAGAACRMTIVGNTNANLYTYLDAVRADGKSIYHMTSIGKIADNNSLKLTSVKRYNQIGQPLFSLTVNVSEPDARIVTGAKAQLKCGTAELAADMTQTVGQFIFNFNTTHFATSDSLTCNELLVTAGDKSFVNSGALNLNLVKQSAALAIGLTLKEKPAAEAPADGINAELVNLMNGTFAETCELVPGIAPAVDTFQVVAFEFKMTAGANKGNAIRTISPFSDKECTLAMVAQPQVTNYDLEILNPALVTLVNTLPISFYKVTGADRVLETHTIVSVTGQKLKFGAKVQGSDAWSGSKDLAALPKELSMIEYALRVQH